MKKIIIIFTAIIIMVFLTGCDKKILEELDQKIGEAKAQNVLLNEEVVGLESRISEIKDKVSELETENKKLAKKASLLNTSLLNNKDAIITLRETINKLKDEIRSYK
jgi:type III secretory pathway lipoprotein EscJ